MTLETEKLIERIVDTTIDALRREGLLKDFSKIQYDSIQRVLRDFYQRGIADPSLSAALDAVSDDPYFPLLRLHFGGETIEQVAEDLGVDVSTVSRNKKRLCLAIYDLLEP